MEGKRSTYFQDIIGMYVENVYKNLHIRCVLTYYLKYTRKYKLKKIKYENKKR